MRGRSHVTVILNSKHTCETGEYRWEGCGSARSMWCIGSGCVAFALLVGVGDEDGGGGGGGDRGGDGDAGDEEE